MRKLVQLSIEGLTIVKGTSTTSGYARIKNKEAQSVVVTNNGFFDDFRKTTQMTIMGGLDTPSKPYKYADCSYRKDAIYTNNGMILI